MVRSILIYNMPTILYVWGKQQWKFVDF